MNRSDLIAESYRRGLLSWKLRPHQLPIYNAVWSAINNKRSLKYVINCSRRFGKTFTMCLIAIEFALRNGDSQIRFATTTAKSLRKIIYPIMKIILKDCPEQYSPNIIKSDDVLVFHNGSEIHLAGTDNGHAENLRGTASHLNILDEAGSMDDLEYVVGSILQPQVLTTGGMTILASTPPVTPAHDYTNIYRECKENDAVSEFTIYENKSLDPDTIELFKKESGGEDSTTWKREYLCQFVVDSELKIIPEWNPLFNNVPEKDQYYPFYHKYVALDSGVRDLTACLFAYYDFQHAKLIIEDEFHMNGTEMTTETIANKVKEKELELWGDLKVNRRVADNNNLILIQDLGYLHDLPFVPTTKDNLDAMINQVRVWVTSGKIAVHPRCEMLLGCLEHAVWKISRLGIKDQFAKSKKYGHYDHLAALVYLVRTIDVHTNPIPYAHGFHSSNAHINPYNQLSNTVQQLGKMFKS